MKEKCDRCGEISDVCFEWTSVFSVMYRLNFCHFCGKAIEEDALKNTSNREAKTE